MIASAAGGVHCKTDVRFVHNISGAVRVGSPRDPDEIAFVSLRVLRYDNLLCLLTRDRNGFRAEGLKRNTICMTQNNSVAVFQHGRHNNLSFITFIPEGCPFDPGSHDILRVWNRRSGQDLDLDTSSQRDIEALNHDRVASDL